MVLAVCVVLVLGPQIVSGFERAGGLETVNECERTSVTEGVVEPGRAKEL